MSREMPVRIRLKALDSLSGVLDKVKAKFPQLDRAVRNTNRTFAVLSKTHEKWSRSVGKIGDKMQSIGGYLTAGITVPVLAVGGLAVKAFADFETALIGVGKTTNLSGEALQDLGNQFQQLSLRLPISTVELLELGKTAAQLGVRGASDILKFSEVMGKLSRATNVAGEEGASDLARFITVTKGSIGDVDRFASALVELGNTSAATENEILGFALRLGGSTALFNVSGTQALGIATTLKSVGIEAEAGASAIQRVMGEMNEAIVKGGTKMEMLAKVTGISSKEIKSRFKTDAVGVLRDFASGLDRLGKNGGEITQALAYFGINGVRDLQTMGALSQNVGLLDEKLRTANDAFKENVALNREFAATANSVDSQTQLMKNSFNALMVTIGADLAPVIVGLLGGLRSVMDFFREHPVIRNMALVVAVVAGSFALLLLGIGSLLTLVPGMIMLWTAFTAVMGAFGIASFAALIPILLVIAKFVLIGVIIGGLIALIWKFRDAIMEGIVKTWNGLKDMLSGGGNITLTNDANAAMNRPLVPAGSPIGGVEARDRMNPEWVSRTNNARVDINVRAPKSTSVVAESEGGFLGIERGMAGAF